MGSIKFHFETTLANFTKRTLFVLIIYKCGFHFSNAWTSILQITSTVQCHFKS